MKSKISSKNFIFFVKKIQWSLDFSLYLISNCQFWSKNYIKIINEFWTKWQFWPKKVITQILLRLYNFVSTLALETTYAYDFPDLFKNNTIAIWREHRATCTQPNCVHPLDSEVCTYQELVLDEDGMFKIIFMQSRN